MFFIIQKSEESTFEFLQNSVMEKQKFVNFLNSSHNEFSKIATKNGALLTVNQRVVIRITIQ